MFCGCAAVGGTPPVSRIPSVRDGAAGARESGELAPTVDSTQAQPNTFTCPVCTAMPGVLPVINRRAVEFALMTALALHCTVQAQNVFARKSYFYPDLPK